MNLQINQVPSSQLCLRQYFILAILVSTISYCFGAHCEIKFCDYSFARTLEMQRLISGPNLPYCLNLDRYLECLSDTRLACRGNLRFHAMLTVTKRHMAKNGCNNIISDNKLNNYEVVDSSSKQEADKELLNKSPPISYDGGFGQDRAPLALDLASMDPVRSSLGQPVGDIPPGRCLLPESVQTKGSSSYHRYCGAFGDPHLFTFDGRRQTCQITGSWTLIDNEFLTITMTGQSGAKSTGIEKILVKIRPLPGCVPELEYHAHSNDLPSDFTSQPNPDAPFSHPMDAYVYASDPISVGENINQELLPNQKPRKRQANQHVSVRTHIPNEHISIRLRHISTRISIRRVGAYLSVAVRIPSGIALPPTRGVRPGSEIFSSRKRTARSAVSSPSEPQLCISGCPFEQQISLDEFLTKQSLRTTEQSVSRSHTSGRPRMSLDEAVQICRDTGTVDFFFDACVFDLLTTGQGSLAVAAVRAQMDVRKWLPAYARHLATNRSSLYPYEQNYISNLHSDTKHAQFRVTSSAPGSYKSHSNSKSWRTLLVLSLVTILYLRNER